MKYIIYDFETTGRSARFDQIVLAGFIVYNNDFNEIERKMAEDPDFDLPNEEHVMPPSIDVQGMIHTDGYEWTDHMGFKWYRVPDTGSDWSRWQ